VAAIQYKVFIEQCGLTVPHHAADLLTAQAFWIVKMTNPQDLHTRDKDSRCRLMKQFVELTTIGDYSLVHLWCAEGKRSVTSPNRPNPQGGSPLLWKT
jgi:hypothetical protein